MSEKKASLFVAELIRDREQFGNVAFGLDRELRMRYLAAETALAEHGMTIEQAVELCLKRGNPLPEKPLTEAIAECLTAKTGAGRKPRTVQQLRYSLDSFSVFIGDQNISSIGPEHIERWLSSDGWSSTTQRTRLIDVQTLFSFCVRRGWLGANPAKRVEPITIDSKAPGILSIGQAKRLMKECRRLYPKAIPYFTLALFAGIRPSEIMGLTWDQVDLKSGHIEIPETIAKGRRHRLIELRPNALAWLRLGGDLPPKNWQRRYEAIIKAAGFKDGDWPQDGMRHSFCTYSMPIFGASQTALWAGHSEAILFEKYRGRPITKDEAEKFWRVGPKD